MAEIKTQNRAIQMLRNLGIYAVGSIGSRLMTFLLVPIYSFFISPSEFGYYDICFVVVMFAVPIISFQLRDGAFRFLLDAQTDDERTRVVTFSMVSLLRGAAMCMVLGVIAYLLVDVRFMWYTLVFAVVFALFEVVQQMLRGLGHNKLFAGCGILSSFFIFAISVPLVAWTDMGIEGVFIGNIAARVIAMLYAEWRLGMFSRYVRFNADLGDIGREIYLYSLPLMAVNLIVIIISCANRFFIEHFLGLHDNGLYAVAVKFAAILDTIGLIFVQAWQETAIRQYGDTDRDVFYTKVLNAFIWLLVVMVVAISFGVRIVYNYIVGAEYQESVWLVLPQCLSTSFLCLVYFYDMGYQCSKNTSRQLPCLIIALVISLVTNYLFTIWWGLYGILASINVTYLFVLLYKMIDTRRYMLLRIDARSLMMVGLLILSGVVYYATDNKLYVAIYFAISLMAMVACCPAFIKQMLMNKLQRKEVQ
ncbi:MAG: lipopolysaccharide biosynthesis protein [Muribaculaceae bacterium]